LASVGLTSAVVNGIVKPLAGRRRPDRATHRVPVGRQVKMPVTHSFPSGHAASAFAFAAGVAAEAPQAGVALNVAAAVVAYSRVHTGVHYPGDVVAGALLGAILAQVTTHALEARKG
jgi:membrane-associated phospholipid phosphatase